MKRKIISILVAVVLLSIIVPPNPGYSFNPTFVVEAEADCEFINLSWSTVNNANGYYVYRGIGQGNQVPEPLTDFPIKDTSYEDWNDIEAGFEYCYFIRAVGSDHKEFAESNEVCAVPICPEDCRLELKFQVGNNVYWINDEPQPAMEAAPEVKWSRTFVLIRYAAETAGATVGWEGSTKSITIETLDGTMIKMQVGNNKATINGKEVQIDANNSKVTPYIIAGRTLCPLRFTGVNLGATGPEDILWDGDTKSAMLYFRDPDCGSGNDPVDDPVIDPGAEPGVHNIFPENPNSGNGKYIPPKGNPTKTSNFTAGLGEDWIPIEYNEGAFKKYAKTTASRLDVNIAEDTFNYYGYPSKVGIRSKEPYLTITEEMKTKPLAITLDFDSAGTDNFMIVLSRSNHPATSDHANPDSPGQNILVYFNTSPYKTQARFGLSYGCPPGPGDNGLSTTKFDRLTNITPNAPKQVTLTLKPNFIRATTTYGYKVESNDEAIHSLEIGTKLYLYIFTFAFDGKGQPVNMGLKSVKSYSGWSDTSDYTPPKGEVVYTENFEGSEGIRWMPTVSSEYAQNAKYDKNAKFGGGKFVASVPRVTVAHHGGFDDWSGVGIKSKYYFVEVTEDMAENPFTVFFDMDQIGSTGYRLSLHKHWNGPLEVFTGFNLNEFGTTPTFRLSNNILQYSKANDNGIYRHDTLPVSPRYISLTIKPGIAKVSTSHGFSNEIKCDWLTVGSKLFLTAKNMPDESDKYAPSSLVLNSIKAVRFEGKTFTNYTAPSGELLYKEEFDNEEQSKLKKAIFTGMHAYPPPECVVKEEHVKYQNGKLNVSVPGSSNPMGGYSLNRLGGVVMKYYPLFGITDDLNKTPLKVTFKLDPANTTEFKIDFTHRGGPTATSAFSHGDIQFHYQTTEKGQTIMSLKSGSVNKDNTEDELLRASTGVPETITFTFKPGQVVVTSSAGDKLSIKNIATLGLPNARGEGQISFQIYAYNHTEAFSKPSAFKLSVDSITVTK
jgi:Copper amine oxidase N-terminal domain